mgnify:FL=1
MQRNEKTVNDSYLIIKNGELTKVSYRNNLKEVLLEKDSKVFESINGLNEDEIADFRRIIQIAADNEYEIYQLTRL